MSDKVRSKFSLQPIEEFTDPEDSGVHYRTSNVTKRIIGGGKEYDLSGAINTSLGFASGVASYVSTNGTTGNVLNANTDERRAIAIIHTGYEYSSSSALGVVTTKNVLVVVGSKVIAELGPGDGFPLVNASGNANDLKTSEITVKGNDATNLAVSYLAVTL